MKTTMSLWKPKKRSSA